MFQLLVQQLLSYLLACLGLVMLQQLQKEDCPEILVACACLQVHHAVDQVHGQTGAWQPASAEIAGAAGTVQPGDASASAQYLAACLSSLCLTNDCSTHCGSTRIASYTVVVFWNRV
jgi:hypothetical protein